MIKSSSSKTNDNVGDGDKFHHTGIPLTRWGYETGEERQEPYDYPTWTYHCSEQALENLKKLSQPVKTEKETIVSCHYLIRKQRDWQEVGHIYHQLGKDAMVTVELDQTKSKTEYKIVEGYNFDRGLISPLLISDSRTQTATAENPAVLVVNEGDCWQRCCRTDKQVYQHGKDSMVIIAHDFKDDFIVGALELRDTMTVIGIKA